MQAKKPLRFFIGSCDASPFTTPLCKLIKENNPDNLILGSSKSGEDLPSGVRKIINTQNIEIFTKILLDSDCIIYDLSFCDVKECEFAIKTLKMGEFQDTKFLICVSSVMAWSSTPAKEKQENDDPELVDEDSETEEPTEVVEEGVEKKVYVKFLENDYSHRNALPEYEYLKMLETLCLSASVSKPSLKSYVLCSGIIYGDQQFQFYEHFKQAWLQKYIVSKQKNRIPMIHIRDLALFIYKITERPPTNPYIFAIDHNKENKQKKIFNAIFKGNDQNQFANIESKPQLEIDIRMQPSKVFDVEETEEVVDEEAVQVQKFTFQWHCKDGLINNIQKLRSEFNISNDLKANRILIQGPPASGKTFYGKLLSTHYNIPLISVMEVVNMKLDEELQNEVNEAKEAQRGEMAEKEQEKLNELKEKREKMGLPIVEEEYTVNPELLQPRIPDELLYKLFQLRLKQNDCINRGYILDGYPRTYKDAMGVFMVSQQIEGEEEDAEKPKILNQMTVPQTVFIYKIDDENLIDKVKNFEEDKITNTHYDEKGMQRRLKIYRDINNEETGSNVLIDFFKQNNIDIKVKEDDSKILYNMKAFIERNGKFKNFMTFDQEAEKERFNLEKQQQIQRETLENQEIQKRNASENQLRELSDEIYKVKLNEQKQRQQKQLKEMSQPLKDYLEGNLMPILTDGINEILIKNPQDPLDFLAEYLFKRSLEVKCSDPLLFMK